MTKFEPLDFPALRQRYQRFAVSSGAGLVAIVVLAAFIIRISGGVTAEGQLIARGDNAVLQHPDGGRVAAVLVQDGDLVEAGASLIRLDGGDARTEHDRLVRQKSELDVRRARLEAAIGGTNALSTSASGGEIDGIVRTQTESLKAERAALSAEIERARRRADGAEAARAVLTGQVDANRRREALIAGEISEISALVDEQLIARTRLTALQREALEIRQRLEALNLEDTRLANEAAAARLDMTALVRRDTDRLWRDMEETELKRADLARQIEVAQARLSRLDFKAPSAGRVHELAVRRAGAVIEPGGYVLSLVPEGGARQARVRLSPTDIDDVKIGQRAKLRFDTFQGFGAPEFQGVVKSIAADRSREPSTGAIYFTVLVDVTEADAARLAALPAGTGAPVSVLIETRQRSLAAWIVDPVVRSFRRMFETA